MPSLSTFQTLPLHIAEAIADYCISNYRIRHSRISRTKLSRQTWEAFYDVSNLWRVIFLRHFCKTLRVLLPRESDGDVLFVDLPLSIEVHKQFYSYVKSVEFVTGELAPEPFSAIAKRYSKVWPKDVTLTSASSLIMRTTLNPVDCTTVDSHVENEKLFRIMQLIRTSMPKLREVQIDGHKNDGYNPDHSANTTEPKLDSLFMDIFKRARKLEVRTWPSLLDGRDAQLLNGSLITSLSYTIESDTEFFAIVLQRIGPTLESLEIYNLPLRSIKLLVFNSDGSPIVYSQLKRLYFLVWGPSDPAIPRIDLSASPFPNLCQLTWISGYPFNDDVLFRGSHDTLEYLHVRIDKTALDILERGAVASGSRYTRLRHLTVMMDPNLADVENGCDRLLEFGANLISPATDTFETNGRCSWQQVFDTFSNCPYASNIRVLSLGGTQLRLLQIVDLIKLLPNMTDLACCFNGLGTNVRESKNSTLLDLLYPAYYPLSHRLKFWEVKGESAVADLVTAAITLAVLCPRFTFAAVRYNRTYEYQAALEEAIESREYHGHRDKIQRLISD